jgi:hypothetical protein
MQDAAVGLPTAQDRDMQQQQHPQQHSRRDREQSQQANILSPDVELTTAQDTMPMQHQQVGGCCRPRAILPRTLHNMLILRHHQ